MTPGGRGIISGFVSALRKCINFANAELRGASGGFSSVSTLSKKLGRSIPASLDSSIGKFSLAYDKISGRDIVRKTGTEVLQAERNFVTAQLRRQELQQALFAVQNKLRDVNKQLDVVTRTDEAFIPLITKEHELAREEFRLRSQHQEADLEERAAYENFTSLLRHLHSEERIYEARMRQWALFGSITVGFLSAFVTWLRFRNPQDNSMVLVSEEITDMHKTLLELKPTIEELQHVSDTVKHLAGALGTVEKMYKTQAGIKTILIWLCQKFGAFKGDNYVDRFQRVEPQRVEPQHEGTQTHQIPSQDVQMTGYSTWITVVSFCIAAYVFCRFL